MSWHSLSRKRLNNEYFLRRNVHSSCLILAYKHFAYRASSLEIDSMKVLVKHFFSFFQHQKRLPKTKHIVRVNPSTARTKNSRIPFVCRKIEKNSIQTRHPKKLKKLNTE